MSEYSCVTNWFIYRVKKIPLSDKKDIRIVYSSYDVNVRLSPFLSVNVCLFENGAYKSLIAFKHFKCADYVNVRNSICCYCNRVLRKFLK